VILALICWSKLCDLLNKLIGLSSLIIAFVPIAVETTGKNGLQ